MVRNAFAKLPAGTLARKLDTFRLLYRLGGASAIALRVLRRLGYHGVMVYELTLDPPPALMEARVPLTYRFLEPHELDAYEAHCPELGREKLEQMLAEGNRCFVAFAGDEIVSSGWVQRGPARVESLGVDLELGPDQVYVHNGYTGAKHRGNRALPALGTRLANVLASEGCRVEIALVEADNLSGVRNAEHIGHARTGTLAELRLGPLHVPLGSSDVAGARFSRGGSHSAKVG